MPDFRNSFTAREVCEGMLTEITVLPSGHHTARWSLRTNAQQSAAGLFPFWQLSRQPSLRSDEPPYAPGFFSFWRQPHLLFLEIFFLPSEKVFLRVSVQFVPLFLASSVTGGFALQVALPPKNCPFGKRLKCEPKRKAKSWPSFCSLIGLFAVYMGSLKKIIVWLGTACFTQLWTPLNTALFSV